MEHWLVDAGMARKSADIKIYQILSDTVSKNYNLLIGKKTFCKNIVKMGMKNGEWEAWKKFLEKNALFSRDLGLFLMA